MQITANLVNISARTTQVATVTFAQQKIKDIQLLQPHEDTTLPYLIPGFVDAHIHIESSMLTPSQFARMAVVHGTVATVSDPHEIANVCGMAGVEYMVADGNTVPFKFYFGAPSCVPATTYETAGAAITVADIDTLLQQPHIHYLAEMMNYPGVLYNDADVLAKIALAKKYNKPVDGHGPALTGENAIKYINAGITTDHECTTYAEALHKLQHGMKILIREGSAAKNFDALIPLLSKYTNQIMFCSDDKHPDALELGHINQLCQRAVVAGYNVYDVLQAACCNPVQHYNLAVGQLLVGDPADCVLVDNLTNFNVLQTYINSQLVASNGSTNIVAKQAGIINNFNCEPTTAAQFEILTTYYQGVTVPVIIANNEQLITGHTHLPKTQLLQHNALVSNPNIDVLKLVVINRYKPAPIAIAFIQNFGIKKGAIASTVAHDSHNIIAVGVCDNSISAAVNLVIANQGGLSYAMPNGANSVLPLPIAGLMTNACGYEVSRLYTQLDTFVKQQMGSTLTAPYMTLSFMALLVIPHLKLSDKGLFDGSTFQFYKQ